jgi:hypothetical protein
MSWGTPIDYAKEYKVENDEHFIVKINERYFALDSEKILFYFKEVFPKKVIIEKIIFEEL